MRAGVFASSQNMQPTEVIDLGLTSKTQAELEEFLRSINHRFTVQTYDLLANNCNNFSDTVSHFLLGRGIPDYIVNLPQLALSTPMGMMLRPMLEGMQNQIRAAGGGGLDPFGGGAHSTVAPSSATVSSSSVSYSAPAPNPAPIQAPAPAVLEEVPLVSAESSPASLDAITIKLLTTKSVDTGVLLLSEEQRAAVERIRDAVRSAGVYNAVYSIEDCLTLLRIAAQHKACQMGTLFLLRLAVLPATTSPDLIHETVKVIAEWLHSGLTAYSGVPSAVMSLCTLSNIISNKALSDMLLKNALDQHIVDCVLPYMTHERVELRQICSTLLYNLCLIYTSTTSGEWCIPGAATMDDGGLSELAVQILCAAMENISDEADGAIRRRRLAITCRILRSCGAPAVALLQDLGFVDGLRNVSSSNTETTSPEEVAMMHEISCSKSK